MPAAKRGMGEVIGTRGESVMGLPVQAKPESANAFILPACAKNNNRLVRETPLPGKRPGTDRRNYAATYLAGRGA
ncbi:hypothetical protein [Vreelandella sp. EE22]